MSKTIQPRKARKAWANTPLHLRRKQIAGHLSEELLLKYNRRSLPVIVGDEVKILRGDKKGETGTVIDIDTKNRRVVIEGITHKKADGTDVALPVDPSNLLVVKLNLEDQRRRDKLGETSAPEPKSKPAKKAAPAAAAPEAPAAEETDDVTEDESE